jgi:hypothetical protein
MVSIIFPVVDAEDAFIRNPFPGFPLKELFNTMRFEIEQVFDFAHIVSCPVAFIQSL